MKFKKPGVRDGYNKWAKTYNTTPNPLIALDNRYTIEILKPRENEVILDAGCGTGRNISPLLQFKSRPLGIDFSFGMLSIAQTSFPSVPLAQADLNKDFPIIPNHFDAVLCALVGEHLTDIYTTFKEIYKRLKYNGRFIFSVFHPEMAFAGTEANFKHDNIEYRLGAEKHSISDYMNTIMDIGFSSPKFWEFSGDHKLAEAIPKAEKYIGQPLLLIIESRKN